MKNAEKIKELHEQIDQLEVAFNIKQEQRNQLVDENRRGSWEFSQLTEEMHDINDKIKEALEQIWKLEEEEQAIKANVGDKIRIIHLEGEDNCYDGREGVIEHIDGIGQLHGSWGGLAVIPEADKFLIIKNE